MKEFLKKHWKTIVIVILLLIICGFIWSLVKSHRESDTWEHNYYALQDSVHYYETKNGELMAYKDALILDKEKLQKYLDMSKEEIKELERKLEGALAMAGQIHTEIRYDTIRMTDSIFLVNDTIYSKFKYEDLYTQIVGHTMITDSLTKSETTLEYIDIYTKLKIGMTDNYKFYAISDNPHLNITNIESVVVNEDMFKQDRKKWGLSVYAGFGVNYGIVNKKVDVGPSLGVALTYDLVQW